MQEVKKNMGRPRKSAEERRQVVPVSLTGKDLDKLDLYADRDGVTRSEYVRRLLVKDFEETGL